MGKRNDILAVFRGKDENMADDRSVPVVASYDVACAAGVYMRQTDAVVFSVTLELDAFILGASYDYNFSGLKPASNGVGGFEMALGYRLNDGVKKRNKSIPCPTFL